MPDGAAGELPNVDVRPQGQGLTPVDIFNPAFWTFMAVIAGIYAILSLGLYVQFSMAGLPNFGHVAFMAVAAYTMAILVVRLEMGLPLASVLAAPGGRRSSAWSSASPPSGCARTTSRSPPWRAARSCATSR